MKEVPVTVCPPRYAYGYRMIHNLPVMHEPDTYRDAGDTHVYLNSTPSKSQLNKISREL